MSRMDENDEVNESQLSSELMSTTAGRHRRVRRWALLAAVLVVLVGWAAWRANHAPPVSEGTPATDHENAVTTWYRCSMPECNDPGSADPNSRCPVCGMKREAVEIHPVATDWYRCSMPECNDPGSADPNSRCPVCGMKREKVDTTSNGSVSEISLDESARELATLATEPVTRRELLRRIRAVGTVTFDERRYLVVSARAAGTIESLHADYTGVRIKAGEELLQIYSLELLEAQNELLRLIWGFGRIPGRGRNRSVDQDLVTARHKLELMGVTPNEIDLLIEKDHEDPYLPVRAPIDGTVVRKEVWAGQWVNRGDLLYEIADLSRLWLLLDLYEEELPWLRLGQTVTVATSSLPGEEFSGRVSFIDPVVDENSRTVKVRVELDNRRGRLKPGMYVTAHVIASLAGDTDAGTSTLAVPHEAVLVTGERAMVYVEVVPGTYRGVRVDLGPLAEDETGRTYYPILGGVDRGDHVVTRGAFVIDSQMQIAGRPSLFDARVFGGEPTEPGPSAPAVRPPPPSASHDHPAPVPERAARPHATPSTIDNDAVAAAAQPICPVLGNPVDPTVYIDYRGVRIYFCCHLCTPKFLTDPDKYIPNLPAEVQERLRAAEARLRGELDS